MKLHFLLYLVLLWLNPRTAFSQINFTANDQGRVPAYNGYFLFGTNPGWYGSSWDDKSLADIAAGNSAKNIKGAGVKTWRPALPEEFLESWGYDIRIAEFNYYASLGMRDHTIFLGSPSAAHKDNNKYGGCGDESVLFKNLYEPIWDGGANGTPVNENNYYALYVYKTVTRYKSYAKFWEIVNEPDYDLAGNGWKERGQAGNWWDNNPPPCDLSNMKAPIFHYIRMLRISYEVIKSVDPTAYVAVGGLGYPAFLDAILRNTDNPANGSVTTAYPVRGGAYFDVLSFHSYPMFNLASYVNNAWVFRRHSDAAVTEFVKLKNDFNAVLANRGYNGTQYPKKLFICTENNIPKKSFNNQIGSDAAQRNYMIKTLVASQQADIKQYYSFVLGDAKTLAEATDAFQTMGLYQKLEGKGPHTNGGAYLQQYSNEGIAFKTCADLLRSNRYDAAKTTAMQLPATIDGGAFRNPDGAFTYVLWAKTTTDLSENATATYSFPAAMAVSAQMYKREWNYSQSNTTANITSSNIVLSATPVFITERLSQLPLPEDPDPIGTPNPNDDSAYQFALSIYPNPVHATTATARFTLRTSDKVRITMYAADGKLMATPVAGKTFSNGTHSVPLNTQKLAAGVYYCRFEAGIIQVVKRITVTR